MLTLILVAWVLQLGSCYSFKDSITHFLGDTADGVRSAFGIRLDQGRGRSDITKLQLPSADVQDVGARNFSPMLAWRDGGRNRRANPPHIFGSMQKPSEQSMDAPPLISSQPSLISSQPLTGAMPLIRSQAVPLPQSVPPQFADVETKERMLRALEQSVPPSHQPGWRMGNGHGGVASVGFPFAVDALKALRQGEQFSNETQLILLNENAGTTLHHPVVEGDIIEHPGRAGGTRPVLRGGVCRGCRRWGTGINGTYEVPYKISGDFSGDERANIDWVFKFYAHFTNVRFVERKSESDFLDLISSDGCWSYLGKVGGPQQLSLGAGCSRRKTIAHELAHALGVGHEQQRSDRTNDVTVHLENACEGDKARLAESPHYSAEVTSYDFASIMHQPPSSFACPRGKLTIESHEIKPYIDIMNSGKIAMSSCDLAEVSRLYGGPVSAPACIPHELPTACEPTHDCFQLLGSHKACSDACLRNCESYTEPFASTKLCNVVPMDEIYVDPMFRGAARAGRNGLAGVYFLALLLTLSSLFTTA